MSKTASFGTTSREGHDASPFYMRRLFDADGCDKQIESVKVELGPWVDWIWCEDAQNLWFMPDRSIALAFTSPPYNCGKDYDLDMSLDEYRELIMNVGEQVYRKLIPGGRYVINVAGLGRTPYIPMPSLFYQWHLELGFLPMGDIIWQKAKAAGNSCAWGSWMSSKAPRMRDIHEYLLVFVKDSFTRPDKGESDITKEEFMAATTSIWEIPAELAKRIGHPAPFPVALAERVIKLFSYVGDVVLDPFVGSGTTCIAAEQLGRHYVGVDIMPEYKELAERRLEKIK